ncbi:MAG: hypothetical protein ACTHU0_16425 [Kofleriaceae bacterium]
MKLVEAEAEGPIEGEDAVVTPPRPPHRRVSISLLFTLTVLTGTVVAIYAVFPARNNALLTEAIERHREPPTWDLARPSGGELRAWAIGVVGKDAPIPALDTAVGARAITVLDRRAAVIRYAVGPDEVTYVIQHGRGISPARAERTEHGLRAIAIRRGKFYIVAVGPEVDATRWLPAVK